LNVSKEISSGRIEDKSSVNTGPIGVGGTCGKDETDYKSKLLFIRLRTTNLPVFRMSTVRI
jgi:hypothetical protein